jgi:hypothetical protein
MRLRGAGPKLHEAVQGVLSPTFDGSYFVRISNGMATE